MLQLSFTNYEHLPFDRPFKHSENGRGLNIITLGACSYVMDITVSCANFGRYIPNILIGRFSSLADGIQAFIGHNHEYKNIVTTYPFDNLRVVKDICMASNISQVNFFPEEKRYNNHYQIIIGNDVWIGAGVTMTGGVKIGSGAIIGTNSFVAKDIPPYAIAVGNPARVIKYRFDSYTIQRLMNIKWWNWDIKKIIETVPTMKNIEKFLSENHPTNGVMTPTNGGDGGASEVLQYRSEGRKIYSFVADFHALHPLWKRVVNGFLNSTEKNSVMMLFLGEEATRKDLKKLKKFVDSIDNTTGKIITVVQTAENELFLPEILRNSTHFITTREMVTVECLDCLYDTNVKIISALDDAIFEGEPAVNWNEVYK